MSSYKREQIVNTVDTLFRYVELCIRNNYGGPSKREIASLQTVSHR